MLGMTKIMLRFLAMLGMTKVMLRFLAMLGIACGCCVGQNGRRSMFVIPSGARNLIGTSDGIK